MPFKLHAITAASLLATCLAAALSLAQGAAPSAPAPIFDPQTILRQMGNRNVGVHDPSTIIKCKDEYWVFYTGNLTPSYHSKDLITWTPGPRGGTLPAAPPWIAQEVPGFRGAGFWAPDIIKIGDQYMLFISASAFGLNTSTIGVETNATLDPADPAYQWHDGGMVVTSRRNSDFNCIDPAAFLDTDGKLWLSFGSFWSGIQLIELDPKTGLRIAPDSPMYNIAHWDSIEASYIYKHDNKYYLFVSLGLCCRGAASTYDTRVGRADKVTGPYLDKNGKDMLLGGGTPFLETEGPYIGPGHTGIIEVDGKFWVSQHFYDGTANGASKLAIRLLTWQDGWPVAGKNP